MVERLERTLDSISSLAKFRGHLYNWYDTRTLAPLGPAYVSSVDSGNLAGHMLALANACLEMLDRPLPIEAALAGIEDAIELTHLAATAVGDERRTQTLTRRHLTEALGERGQWRDSPPASPAAWRTTLGELALHTRTLSDVAAARSPLSQVAPRRGGRDLGRGRRAAVESHLRDRGLPWPLSGGRRHARRPGREPAQAGDRGSARGTLERRLRAIADQAQQLFREMDFGFLFDPTRKLFSIGYRVTDGTLDPSYYDLLASEARLASFLAIAKGDVDADHWFRLGRALTPVGRGSALISWSGSMFEYLMPALVMRAHPLSLMDQTYRLVVARQMSYAAGRGVPWGSPSRPSTRATSSRPTSTRASASPASASSGASARTSSSRPTPPASRRWSSPRRRSELRAPEPAGATGPFGFREALDYTPRRLPEGRRSRSS